MNTHMHSTKARCSSSHIVAKWVSNWYIYPRIPPTQAARVLIEEACRRQQRARRLISGGHAYSARIKSIRTKKIYINPYCLHWHSGLLREDRGEVGATWAMVKYNRPWVHWLTERASSARDIGHAVHIIYIIYMSWVMRQHIRIGHSSCKYSPSVWKQAHQHAVVMYSIPEPLFLTMTRRRRTRPSLVYRGPQNANYAHTYTPIALVRWERCTPAKPPKMQLRDFLLNIEPQRSVCGGVGNVLQITNA